MKKLFVVLMMVTLVAAPFCKADEKSDLEAKIGAVYDRIPDASYVVTLWLPSGKLEYKPCSSCEEARRVAYEALYYEVAVKAHITSTYPTIQTNCWNMISKKIFTKSNINDLL